MVARMSLNFRLESHFCFPSWRAARGWMSCAVFFLSTLIAEPALSAWVLDSNQIPVQNGEVARYWTTRNTVTLAGSNAIAVDAAGNVYSTGYRDTGGASAQDMVTAKHDPAGNLLWEAVHDAGSGDEGIDIKLDSAGNVYVTGQIYNGSDYDVVTVKYLSDGTQTWLNVFDGATGNDKPVAIDVNQSTGDVYVAVQSDNGTDQDILTVRYDAAGSAFPARVYSNPGDDRPVGIAVDGAGNVYVGGTISGASNDFVVLKYGSTLTPNPVPGEAWPQIFDSGQRDDATAMALDDNNGRLYITGWNTALGPRNFATVAYDADGSQAWLRTTSYLNGIHIPAALTVDGAGNVYVAGKSGTVESFDYLSLKYDANGTVQWSGTYDGGINEEPVAIAVDGSGNVTVVGQSGATGGRNLDVLFYGGAGTLDDILTYDGGGDETAHGIALGPDNGGRATVHVAGSSDRRLNTGLAEGDYSVLKFGEMRADLTVGSLIAPTQGASTSTINVDNTIENLQNSAQGNLADAPGFDVGFYLADSADPNTANLTLMGTRTISTLPSGQSDNETTVLAIPPASVLPIGTYWIAAKADNADTVPEWDKSNNLVIGNAISIIDPPDLTPTAISGPGSAKAADTISLSYTVANIRSIAAGSFTSSFVLSADTTIGNSDDIVLTGTDVISGIPGNGQVTVPGVAVTIPNNTPAGDYYIGVIVDILDDVLEADETNNTLSSTPAQLTVLPIPDLSITAISGEPSAVIGASTVIDNTVISADASAGSVTVDFYLSVDQVITASDILLGSRTIGSLPADQANSAQTTVTIPGSVTQGVYYIGGIVDGGDTIVESDETNNARAADATISVGSAGGDPDLIISSVSGPASAARGSSITVSTTVENILPPAISASFDIGIYLSTDPVITTGDVLLGARTVAGLGGNTSNTGSTVVTIPFEKPDPVTWDPVSLAGVTASGNSLTKTASTGWNAGASSTQSIDADGAMEFTADAVNTIRLAGLSNSDPDVSFISVRYGVYLSSDGCAYAMELGVFRSSCNSYNVGDVFRITRAGSQISYSQNGTVFYLSSLASTGSLIVDTSLYSTGAVISNVNLINNIVPGVYYLGAIADYQGVITEVNEANNAAVQVDSGGAPSGTPVSAQSAGVSGVSPGSGGGGLLGWQLLMVLMGMLILRARAR